MHATPLRVQHPGAWSLLALLTVIALQFLHFHHYYGQPAGRAAIWAVVDWSVWFLLVGLLHRCCQSLRLQGRQRVAYALGIVLLGGLAQIILSTAAFRLILPPSRPFWVDILHLYEKRWLPNLCYAILLWQFFSFFERRDAVDTQPAAQDGASGRRPLKLADGKVVHWLRPDEIDYLESARNYVLVHAGARSILVRESLKNLATRLPPGGFIQVSRSHLVSRDQIIRVEPYSRHSKRVVLAGGARLRIGRTHLASVEEVLRLR